ncbi:hypothetical protein PS710_06569 [Pseudomonas fluorescens]|nr:hypothetical protein PS710_06569 [Pseudomonas fluorescens]
MAAGLGHVFVKISQQRLAAAAGFFAEREHRVELVLLQTLVAFVALGVLQHLLEHHHVLQAVGHPGIRRQTVTAAATGFLVIRFKGFGQIEVSDEAHVGLIDAHAECHGGDHDQAFLVEEAFLVVGPGIVGQTGVIGQRREPLFAEEHRDFVDLLARQAIDDAGIAAPFGQEREQLLARLLLGHDTVENVRAVEAREETLGVLQMQAIDDFFPGALVGGRGQGDARDMGEQLRQLAQLQVFAAEVVAPLGHAMRFIDSEQGDVKALQERQHARLNQALGRQIEHLHFTALDPGGQVPLLLGAQCGVECSRGDTQFFEGRDLIVHQCDQRRDHHRQAFAQQGRHLEAQGLAAAGRHQHQGVAAAGHALNDCTLAATETVVAEDVLEDALSLFEHKNSRNHQKHPCKTGSEPRRLH